MASPWRRLPLNGRRLPGPLNGPRGIGYLNGPNGFHVLCCAIESLFAAPSLPEMTETRQLPSVRTATDFLKTTEAHQLPGVKGQWILCSECPPTAANADKEGDVQLHTTSFPRHGFRFDKFQNVLPIEYWRPIDCLDTRPFTLPTIAAASKPKLAVGQVWRRVDGKTITIITKYESVDRFGCSEGYVYRGDGKAYNDTHAHIEDIELVELVQGAPKESVDQQAASAGNIERDIEEFLISDSGIIFAKANDGTIWRLFEESNPTEATTDIFWVQLPPLPTHQIQSND